MKNKNMSQQWLVAMQGKEILTPQEKPSENNPCGCASCHEGEDYAYLKSKLSEEDQEVLERLYAELVHTRIDLNWYEAVFDGSWPNAEEHMARAGWVKAK